jgi:hypothetical protein
LRGLRSDEKLSQYISVYLWVTHKRLKRGCSSPENLSIWRQDIWALAIHRLFSLNHSWSSFLFSFRPELRQPQASHSCLERKQLSFGDEFESLSITRLQYSVISIQKTCVETFEIGRSEHTETQSQNFTLRYS